MSRIFVVLGLTAIASLSVGCGPKADPPGTAIVDDHDHGHVHATTFEGAVTELAEMRDTIRDGIAADNEEEYHAPLHEVGHVLENLKKFAEDLDDESEAKATEAIDKLFDLFDKVDLKFHGKEGVDYGEVSVDVDAAIETLEGLASSPPDPAVEGDDKTKDDAPSADPPATVKEAPPAPPVDDVKK